MLEIRSRELYMLDSADHSARRRSAVSCPHFPAHRECQVFVNLTFREKGTGEGCSFDTRHIRILFECSAMTMGGAPYRHARFSKSKPREHRSQFSALTGHPCRWNYQSTSRRSQPRRVGGIGAGDRIVIQSAALGLARGHVDQAPMSFQQQDCLPRQPGQ